MSRPTVSLVMPAFNAARTIGAALSSAIDQTYEVDQLIVVDDASTDATVEIARAFPKVRVLQQDGNRGPSAARNRAITEAGTELIAWLDADDMWLPTYLETMVSRLQAAEPRSIATSDALMVTPTGITGRRLLTMPHPAPARQRLAMMRSSFVTALAVYPRSMHDEIGLLDTELRGGEDRDLWLRAMLHGWTVVRQPEPLALYRWTGPSASSRQEQMDDGEDRLLAKALSERGWTLKVQERDYLQLRLSLGSPRRLVARANTALREGDYALARDSLLKAATLLPEDRRLRARLVLLQSSGGARVAQRLLQRTDRRLGWNSAMSR